MKKTKHNQTLTPEQYIRQKARTLELGQCYMNKNWFISGVGIAVVCRCHKKDTYTFGVFQLDTFCSGLVECKIEFSRDKESYENIMAYLKNTFGIEPVTYQEVHNLIYGAVAFGEDAGFTPPNIYNLAKFLLEEDTEDIPLINYQFGKYGKHFLWAESEQELDEFMPHLIHHLGKENVLFGLMGSDAIFKGEDFYDSQTRAAMRKLAAKIRLSKEQPVEEYSYKHPDYPTELNLKHQELADLLYDSKNYLTLSDEQINSILALPHDEVRSDLEQIALYETGKTSDAIPVVSEENRNSVLLHCIILLGQLGYKESLPVVLETLSQKKLYYNYHFGIILNETYVPTLYQLGKDQLDKLEEYLYTPGLYTYARYLVFPILVQIIEHEPERREEVIEWLRNILNFYAGKLENNECCDGSLIGLLTTDIIKLKGEELLPELKVLFETGKVNEECCGSYEKVAEQINKPSAFYINYQFDVFEHYATLRDSLAQITIANNDILKNALEEQEVLNEKENTETEPADVHKDANDIEDAEEVVKEETSKAKSDDKKTEAKVTKKSTKKTTVKESEAEAVSKPAKKTATKTATTKGSKADAGKEGKAETAKVKKATTEKTAKKTKEKVSEEATETKVSKPRKSKAKTDK